MVEAVGATNLLSDKGEPSHTVTHREIRDALPRCCCSCPAATTWRRPRKRASASLTHPEIADTPAARNGNVFAVDATSFFSRPGPRIVDGLEIVAWAVHPEAYPEPSPGSITRLR